jgi:hypothetical protein
LQSISHAAAFEQSMPALHAAGELQSIWHVRPAGHVTGPPSVVITHVLPDKLPPTLAHVPSPALPPPSPSSSNPMRPHPAIAITTGIHRTTPF